MDHTLWLVSKTTRFLNDRGRFWSRVMNNAHNVLMLNTCNNPNSSHVYILQQVLNHFISLKKHKNYPNPINKLIYNIAHQRLKRKMEIYV